MGYITTYTLKADSNKDAIVDLRFGYEDANYAVNDDGSTNESCKWYSHEEDLKGFSLLYPDTLFELHGKGQDEGDLWAKYFKNGKVQVAKAFISYPPFDETLLK